MSYSTPLFFFFFNDTATTEIYTLSLHDALPISLPEILPVHGDHLELSVEQRENARVFRPERPQYAGVLALLDAQLEVRSEEHTSELQSQSNLVCRLLLEKKKKKK